MKVEDKVLDLAKRRGFVWGPSPNIYDGGLAGFYDWGPLGKLLKNKVENVLKKGFMGFGFWEVECPSIMPAKVWEASGHLDGLTDYVTNCNKCGSAYRVDHLMDDVEDTDPDKLKALLKKRKIKCPSCNKGTFDNVEKRNLMMKTGVGLDQEVFLRPETATTTYLLFPELYRFFRTKMPFGVFQIGKAYRNEINPRQGVFRTREFTQAEAQLFILSEQEKKFEKFKEFSSETFPLMKYGSKKTVNVKLGDVVKKKYMKTEAYSYIVYVAYKLVKDMGFDPKKIRIRQHNPNELVHYAKDAWDIEVNTDRYGWFELCGVHDRADYDLKQHSKFSKTKMEVSGEIPKILEIAFGLERTTYALLENSLIDDKKRDWLSFDKGMAPIDVAVFPLMKKDGMDKVAKETFEELDKEFVCVYDSSGSIGRRYRRMDEVGTSFCITIDHDSLKKKDVTIREVSTMKQARVKISNLKTLVRELLSGDLDFKKIK
ncbi:glycine--tRNA ligase [Candidatus Woesearchaeota archaeon]|jgi:glycyl-tRNA synthetase|nr:glycine--tRNA ligase [Candidatus Woesearchaeota archaeon]MBT4322192.1 glycine--tRNA ligase [Candidatus Woesearchaeota archaeon]MBT4631212.1 glycine--tRNA ligase [Candidatus Woesearchaeota archaeon]